MQHLRKHPRAAVPELLRRHGTKIVFTCVAGCIIAANSPFPEKLPFATPLFMPTFLVASVIFMIFAMVLANAPGNVFVNRSICSLGKLSFSAYLVHFAILHKLPEFFPVIFDRQATNWSAILACGLLWVVALLTTYGISLLTYHAIEEPMIGVGRRLIMTRRRLPASAAS